MEYTSSSAARPSQEKKWNSASGVQVKRRSIRKRSSLGRFLRWKQMWCFHGRAQRRYSCRKVCLPSSSPVSSLLTSRLDYFDAPPIKSTTNLDEKFQIKSEKERILYARTKHNPQFRDYQMRSFGYAVTSAVEKGQTCDSEWSAKVVLGSWRCWIFLEGMVPDPDWDLTGTGGFVDPQQKGFISSSYLEVSCFLYRKRQQRKDLNEDEA